MISRGTSVQKVRGGRRRGSKGERQGGERKEKGSEGGDKEEGETEAEEGSWILLIYFYVLDTMKLQGRHQTMADVNKMTKFLGVEIGRELLQWTTKMENYKRYKWTTGDLSACEGPPILVKPGWNVEYPKRVISSLLPLLLSFDHIKRYRGDVPWGKLNFEVEDKQKDVCWYHEHFYKKPHATYLSGDSQNPLFIAVDTDGSPPYLLFSPLLSSPLLFS